MSAREAKCFLKFKYNPEKTEMVKTTKYDGIQKHHVLKKDKVIHGFRGINGRIIFI